MDISNLPSLNPPFSLPEPCNAYKEAFLFHVTILTSQTFRMSSSTKNKDITCIPLQIQTSILHSSKHSLNWGHAGAQPLEIKVDPAQRTPGTSQLLSPALRSYCQSSRFAALVPPPEQPAKPCKMCAQCCYHSTPASLLPSILLQGYMQHSQTYSLGLVQQ